LAELGVAGILVPDEHGGSGLTLLDAAIAAESLAWGVAPAPFLGTAVMALLVVPCQLAPEPMIRVFSTDPAVVAVGAEFLRIISWNFVATGVIFTAGGLFQALGNTVPSLAASAIRLATFAVPAVWMSTAMAGFELRHLWYLSVATVLVQMCLSLVLLRHEMGRKLTPSTT
jgi:Na+-driven multidrug efflux pump